MLSRAELHITYRCDLGCGSCNRGCFIPDGSKIAPDMTMADVAKFLVEVEAAKKQGLVLNDVVIIGGEPTLHPNLLDIVRQLTAEKLPVTIFSNAWSERANVLLDYIKTEKLCQIYQGTHKSGRVDHARREEDYSIYVSPTDIGIPAVMDRWTSCPCYTGCGFSVDSEGYTPCAIGGMIDSVLALGARTQQLSFLLNPKFVRIAMTMLCKHCGAHCCSRSQMKKEDRDVMFGTVMSPTWIMNFKRLLDDTPDNEGYEE